VRFVIHHSMPKSLEAFQQESGRAGRDGQPAHSVLFFTYADKKSIEFMIKRPDENGMPKSLDQVRSNMKKLYQMVSYCENNVDCRRVQLLHHFDEHFDPADCGGRCDNCRSTLPGCTRDVTKEAQAILRIVRHIFQKDAKKCRAQTIADVFRGSKSKNVAEFVDLPDYNSGKGLTVSDAERLLHQMILEGFLEEYSVQSVNSQFPTDMTYIKIGPEAESLMQHSEQSGAFTMTFRKKAVSSNTGTATAGSAASGRCGSILDSMGKSSSGSSKRGTVVDLASGVKPARPKVLHPLQLASAPSSRASLTGGSAARAVLAEGMPSRSRAGSPSVSAAHAFDVDDCGVIDVEQSASRKTTSTSKKKSPAKSKAKGLSSGASVASASSSSAAAASGPPTIIELDGSSDAASDDVDDDEEDMPLPVVVPRARPPLHATVGAAGAMGLDRFARSRGAPAAASASSPSTARAPATQVMGEDSGGPPSSSAQDVLTDDALTYELSELLKEARQHAAEIQDQSVWSICNNLALEDVVRKLPCNKEQLARCQGFGLAKAANYALTFLPIIHNFIVQHDIPLPPTHQVPLSVYKSHNKNPPPHAMAVGPAASVDAAPMQLAPVFRAAAAASAAPLQKSAFIGGSATRAGGYQLPLQQGSAPRSSVSASSGSKAAHTSPHFVRSGESSNAPGDKRRHRETFEQLFGQDDDDLEDLENARPAKRRSS